MAMAGAKRPASVAAAHDEVSAQVRDMVPAALMAVGLQYCNPAHFFAAIRRDEPLAVGLFLSSAAVAVDAQFEGETARDVAHKARLPHLVSLLQRHASLPRPVTSSRMGRE